MLKCFCQKLDVIIIKFGYKNFKRPATNEYEIKCYPVMRPTDEESGEKSEPDPKPKALLAMEEEQRNDYFNE